jgi:hypothetical protein
MIWDDPAEALFPEADDEARGHDASVLMSHEAYNVYTVADQMVPYLEGTWFLIIESGIEKITGLKEGALDDMLERLQVRPVTIDREEMLFAARYELKPSQETLQFAKARLRKKSGAEIMGWMDLLMGFPYGACEMLALCGEVSSEQDQFEAQPTPAGQWAPPTPKRFFEGYDQAMIPFNEIWLEGEDYEVMAEPLRGADEDTSLLWWLRLNFSPDKQFPWPGEFVALGVRIFPNLPFGEQKTSPFLFSGNWVDTVFYTSATVAEVHPDASGEFNRYTVNWRGQTLELMPTDFAEYREGDRVAIVKDVSATKQSQLWKDEDQKEAQGAWRIAPVTFYGRGLTE